ncbi:crossover junction endodeoxyribonuclease RuvC [Propionimicrobium sp. PCR01-08-3]|uniref:crossover junction endodeoxyribonuclease RuvC n=1 Tax=Propionimicrobium sp. PCR01-08-3 TaxID=3052086 RepID=UPI00255CAF85|nr:crossover junction endodeoxyribonuclease RuvC [Propionimicrobium sp. PCR01-08-3]WIY84193.1 crossover junction endodeoxyribonuclease RuvC [Propionimicrobium sp. PCR01-08-3]
MRILGVDPGLTRCGVGVIDAASIRNPKLVDVGVIRTPADLDHAHRLLAIEQGLESWIQANRPDAIAVERVFAQHNKQSVTGTAQAAGIAMLIAARHSIPVVLHTPTEVKAAITGSGAADKAQVGAMVVRILKLDAVPKPADAADAVALALCHLWRGGAVNRYAAAAEAHAAKIRVRTGGR